MSVLEIWGAEYQENDCLLIKPADRALLERVCARERCIMQVGLASLLRAAGGLRAGWLRAGCCSACVWQGRASGEGEEGGPVMSPIYLLLMS
jgi:hypothetical protein